MTETSMNLINADGSKTPITAAGIRDVMMGAARMKETPEDEEVRSAAFRVTAAELRQFIERAERLEDEKKATADQIKEVFAEAKGRGYDVRCLKKLIALRKREPNDVSEEEAILDLYRDALGM